jgi:hypothetical protein
MQWLVTFPINVTLEMAEEALTRLGCDTPPIPSFTPLGDDEQVIAVDGPKDLPEKAKGHPIIIKVYPNSRMHPHESGPGSAGGIR